MRQHPGLVLASVISIGLVGVGAASAADMAPRYTKVPPAPIVAYNWTGCYIGGNVGGGWARTEQQRIGRTNGTVLATPEDFGTDTPSDFLGGGQIGCDYQFNGSWVVGVQGMFDFGRIGGQHILPTAFPAQPVGTFNNVDNTKNMFTATARIGYLFTPQLLGYVKGGGAWTRQDYFVNGVATSTLLESATGVDRQGWTVGGGLEYMFLPGWSVFGEFNYMDFGRKTVSFVNGPTINGLPDVMRIRLTTETALVGINYKFNWGGPVVAKY